MASGFRHARVLLGRAGRRPAAAHPFAASVRCRAGGGDLRALLSATPCGEACMARGSTRLDRRQFLTVAGALLGATLLPRSHARALVTPGLEFATAGAAARAIRRGEVSSLELTTLMLERIKQHNPGLNAVVTVAADSALERAKAADEASARGEWWGP